MPAGPYDEFLLRRAFAVARRARDGDHPFGSLLADKDGKVRREQGTAIVGPLLAEEAAALQHDFWNAAR
jgi:hypothetical protein